MDYLHKSNITHTANTHHRHSFQAYKITKETCNIKKHQNSSVLKMLGTGSLRLDCYESLDAGDFFSHVNVSICLRSL